MEHVQNGGVQVLGSQPMKANTKRMVQGGLLLLAIGFTVYGAYRGEAATVLGKAIRLCLECVGIG